MYGLTSIQGSFQALRDVNAYIHFSQWTVGHAHLALLGSFGFLVAGLFYWLVPKLTKKKLYSAKLMSLSYWLALLGFILFFSSMTIAGLVANAGWWQHLSIAIVLPSLDAFFIARAIGGGIVVVAAYVAAYNIIRTFMSKSSEQSDLNKPIEVHNA